MATVKVKVCDGCRVVHGTLKSMPRKEEFYKKDMWKVSTYGGVDLCQDCGRIVIGLQTRGFVKIVDND